MRRFLPACPPLSLALSCLLLSLSPPPASAQAPLTRTQFGVGYIANAPEEMGGGAAYVILPKGGGIGFYVDAKFDVSSPTNKRGYEASVTSLEVVSLEGSHYVRTEESWKSFNAAIIRPINPSFMVYAGGGVAKLVRYDLYDVTIESGVGVGGVALVENPETAETRTNLMAGIMMRLSSTLTAHFGFETQPDGVTAGFTLRLPRW